MLKEFKEFALKGNMLDLAVGMVIGASFGGIVKSIVDDIFNPIIGMLVGGRDFSNYFLVLKEGATPGPYASLTAAKTAGAGVVSYGMFINAATNFIIVALCLFIVVKIMNTLKRKQEAVAPPSNQEVLLTEIRDLLKNK